MPAKPVFINQFELCCALGNSRADVENQLFSSSTRDTLSREHAFAQRYNTLVGAVSQTLAPVATPTHRSRNNQLLQHVLTPLRESVERLKARYGPQRIGVIVGTSTSGIAEGEQALCHHNGEFSLQQGYAYSTQELAATALFCADYLGVSGPCWTTSSACTSGSKALVSAARMLSTGLCDAVIAAGVDSLCHMTLQGFGSLSVISDSQCLPFSRNRSGINIGEGAAAFIVSHETAATRVLGWGETSDAHHISSPEPNGNGAEAAMRAALTMAQLPPEAVGYINLHGTGTKLNDQMEARAVTRVFGHDTPCSSTKSLTGHTLAAAGALEAAFCLQALQHPQAQVPSHYWDGQADPDIPALNALGATQALNNKVALSNSFAFGGNNLALLLGAE